MHNEEAAALWRVDAELRETAFGNFGELRREKERALKLASGNRDIEAQEALVDAWSGDMAAARKLETDLKERYPLDTLVNDYWLPTVEARAELATNNAAAALSRLQAAPAPMEFGFPVQAVNIACLYPVYTRAVKAYLAAGQGSAATAEFQKILDRPGIVQNCPTGALAHLGLDRAYALSGDTDKTRRKYQDFLALWKGADPDIPILERAKAEYTKLRQ